MARKKQEQDNGQAEGQAEIRTPWNLKTGTEIPEEYDGAVLQVRRLALTDDAAEALRRVLVTAGADEDISVSIDGDVPKEVAHAIVDNWNQPLALNGQKEAKTAIKEARATQVPDYEGERRELPTLDDLQAILDEFTMVPNQRRLGAGSRKERETLGKQVQEVRARVAAGEVSEEEAAILAKYGFVGS